MPAARNTV